MPPRSRTLAAWQHRSFRLFWIGLLLSLVGGWMQQVAAPWLVYRLTDSSLALGMIGFLAAAAAAPLALVVGPLVDRFPRRSLLLLTQAGLLLPPIGLALLTWSGRVQVWHLVVAEILRGVVLTVDQPAKQVAVMEMTGKEDVGSGIALWNAAINVARVVGPAIAGLLVAWGGEGICFFVNGISYLAVIAALLVIRLPVPQPVARRSSLGGSLLAGWKYLLGERLLMAIAGLSLLVGVFVRPFQTLLPVVARDVLQGGPTTLGWMTAAAGAGALLGALGAASVSGQRQRIVLMVVSLALPFTVIALAVSHSFALSCALLLVVGGGAAAVETVANALVLVDVRDEFRGRVMTVFMAAAMGAPRIGGLQAGWLADRVGAPLALVAGAVVSLACAVAVTIAVHRLSAGSQQAMRNAQHVPPYPPVLP